MSAVLLHEGGDKVGLGNHAGDHLYILSELRSLGCSLTQAKDLDCTCSNYSCSQVGLTIMETDSSQGQQNGRSHRFGNGPRKNN